MPGLAVAIAYFVACKLGLAFATVHPSATAVWPGTGIAFAGLMLFGYRIWPAIFASSFLVNLITAGSQLTSLGIATGNTLEGLLGAWLVTRFAGGLHVFARPRDIFKFVGLACLLSTTVSATIGVTTLALAGYAPWAGYGGIWLTWWLGDGTGDLIVGPLLILWARPRVAPADHKFVEVLLLALSVLVTGLLVFGGFLPPAMRNSPLEFLCIAPLLWAAFRFGSRETATAVALLALIAEDGTFHGLGPFAPFGPDNALILLQAFMAGMAAITLPIAALISELRRAEAEARTSRAAADQANRVKDRFLAILGHELRDPLGAIAGAVHALGHDGASGIEMANARAIICRQSDHLATIVDDLLDLARIEQGRLSLVREPVNLAECVVECIAALSTNEQLRYRDVVVRTENAWVDGDPHRLAQVVTNLVLNAAKYTSPGSRIVVRTRVERERAMIQVEDNGAGISAKFLPHVFDLFTRQDAAAGNAAGGLGIGLAIARTLVELHGGTIDATSAGPHLGSVFTVRLPRMSKVVRKPAVLQRPQERAGSCRILIVEDNEDARSSLHTVLALAGHEVFESEGGQGSVDAALALMPDAAIIDISLPGIDGYEIARRIRSASGGSRIFLIALTGYGQPEDRKLSYEAGFNLHLVKPLRFDELFDVLAAVAED